MTTGPSAAARPRFAVSVGTGSGSIVGLARTATDPLTTSIVLAIEAAAAELGIETAAVDDAVDAAAVGVLLAVGPPQASERLLAGLATGRRIAWFGEPLPRPAAAGASDRSTVRRLAGGALGRLQRRARRLRSIRLPGALDRLRAAAYVESERRANLAAALRVATVADDVVVTSRDRAAILAAHGVRTRVVPFGYHAALAGPIVDPAEPGRDLGAVAFGSGLAWSSRRARGLRACAARLGPDRLLVTPATWGEDRNALLRRARVLLDVHRVPGNFIGLRVLYAAAAGAVLVTEPMDDPHPFVPGRHYVEAPLGDLPAAVEDVLSDEPRRRAIADAAQALVTGQLTMSASLRAVLG